MRYLYMNKRILKTKVSQRVYLLFGTYKKTPPKHPNPAQSVFWLFGHYLCLQIQF